MELVGEAFISHLEFSSIVFDVVYLEGTQSAEDLDRSDDQLLALFSSSLFDWARAWELTSSDSLPLFLSSLLLCN